MATTTNYSWTTPDDTDLVKDGASAIRSLGTAIDSTVFTNAGNAVQKSTIDAKGDLLVGTADNTVGRLAVGTNDYVLTADSNETSGMKWAAAAAGGMTLLESGSLSGSSVTTGTLSGSYEDLRVLIKNAQPGTDGAVIQMRFNADTGTNYRGVSYADFVNTTFASTLWQITEGIDNTAGNSITVLTIPDYANTTTYKFYYNFTAHKSHDTGTFDWIMYNGVWSQTSAVTSITWLLNNGTFSAGTYEVWGIK